MKLGAYLFKPDRKTTIVGFIFVFILTSLGLWQVARYNEKQSIEEKINTQNLAAGVDLNNTAINNADEYKYRKATVRGKFINQGLTFIDNVKYNGEYGFYVYSPLKLEASDKHILVNHGWIPFQGSRDNLPSIIMSDEQIALKGTIQLPSKRPFVESSIEALKMEQSNLWLYMDIDKYGQEASIEILPFVLYLEPNSDETYIRDWPVFNSKLAMHTGYAIMWFSLAFIAFCIFVYSSLRKSEGDQID